MYVIKENGKLWFFLIMLFGSLKNLEKFEYSLTFYMSTMKSCFSSNLRKKIYK